MDAKRPTPRHIIIKMPKGHFYLVFKIGLPTALVTQGPRDREVKKKEIFLKQSKRRGKHKNRIKLERKCNVA